MTNKTTPSSSSKKRRTRYPISAQLSRAEHEQIAEQLAVAGCTPSDLVRSALKLDRPVRPRPLLVAAGQLIRAGNAHSAAVARGEWTAASDGIDELNRLARELIRLAVEERQLT